MNKLITQEESERAHDRLSLVIGALNATGREPMGLLLLLDYLGVLASDTFDETAEIGDAIPIEGDVAIAITELEGAVMAVRVVAKERNVESITEITGDLLYKYRDVEKILLGADERNGNSTD